MDVIWQSFSGFDIPVFVIINRLPHTFFFDETARVIHFISYSGVIILGIFLLNILSKDRKRKFLALLGTVSFVVTAFFVECILKPVIHRQRPYVSLQGVIDVLPNPGGYSFPSTQTAMVFALAAVYWLIFPKTRESYLVITFAIITGIDRIYMADHFPTDVVAGAIIGYFIGIGLFRLVNLPKIRTLIKNSKIIS